MNDIVLPAELADRPMDGMHGVPVPFACEAEDGAFDLELVNRRRARWFGEAEGLKVSLAGTRNKLAQMDQISTRRNAAVHLGIPSFSEAAGRTVSTSLTGPDNDQHE